MAAFRARNLEGRLALDVEVSDAVEVSMTGFVFCASFSEILMLCFSGRLEFEASYWPICPGGLLLLNSDDIPAIEVSGMFVLRGGGGVESRECGRYPVAVESFRLFIDWT